MSLQLPDALAHWGQPLQELDSELAEALADLAQRLHNLVGPVQRRQSGELKEPDGLGDLQRRGPYERLLPSEWLLADAFPDEFLRRAASGEHLFLASEARACQGNRTIIALFDAGPRQLGAPRLAHIAMLILLARRAQAVGGELRWGILQQPGWIDGVRGAVDFARLLEARRWQAAAPDDWRAWNDLRNALPATPDECWLIGAQATDDGFSHRLHLSTSLDGEALEAELHLGNSRRALNLPLPSPAIGRRLLSGQFALAGQVPAGHAETLNVERVALTLPPVISRSGQMVALALLDQPGVLVFKLPALGSKKKPRTRRLLWSTGEQPLALAFTGRSLGGVMDAGPDLRFWQLSPLSTATRPPQEVLSAPPGTARLLPLALVDSVHDGERLYLVDAQGRLLHWHHQRGLPRSQEPLLERVETDVLAMSHLDDGRLYYLHKRDQRFILQEVLSGHRMSTPLRLGEVGEASKAFMARFSTTSTHPACALLLSATPQERWRLCRPEDRQGGAAGNWTLDVPPGWSAQGLVADPDARGLLLVLMSGDHKRLALYDGSALRSIVETPDAIARLSVCASSGLLAVLSQARELVLYCTRHHVVRLRASCTRANDQGGTP
ncbi:hypothetical protein [Metapseudomonas otitidis]|uniref:hypothetical protein n=1 Tax=Metapseudomonas otitidis TaxID=319939 RepID=UPI0013F69247|nr:hypothetical protein [Pseudomonas otitidis]